MRLNMASGTGFGHHLISCPETFVQQNESDPEWTITIRLLLPHLGDDSGGETRDVLVEDFIKFLCAYGL